MTFWGNAFTFPSPEEVVRTRSTISKLESYLEQILEDIRRAQTEVEFVKRHLNQNLAFIAPIRKANFDILSLIFEIVAKDDWRAPLHISGVSRLWREVIQRTRRAWSVVDRRRIGDNGSLLYLNYSLPSSLHVHEAHISQFGHLAQMANKIECLTVTVMWETKMPVVFPNLKRLVAGGGFICQANVAMINTSRFPNLRHLDLDATFVQNSPIMDFPPLETLAIVLYNAVPWFDIIKACKDSLISLRSTIVTHNGLGLVDNKLHLPQLSYLEIIARSKPHSYWQIQIEAPSLETYIERSDTSWFDGRFHKNFGSVKNLRLSYLPELDNMEQLQILQLDLMSFRLKDFLDKAESGDSFLPNLRILELGRSDIPKQDVEEFRQRIKRWYWDCSPDQMTQQPRFEYGWGIKMPGEKVFECGYEPCTRKPGPRVHTYRSGRIEDEEEEEEEE